LRLQRGDNPFLVLASFIPRGFVCAFAGNQDDWR